MAPTPVTCISRGAFLLSDLVSYVRDRSRCSAISDNGVQYGRLETHVLVLAATGDVLRFHLAEINSRSIGHETGHFWAPRCRNDAIVLQTLESGVQRKTHVKSRPEAFERGLKRKEASESDIRVTL